jgi:hypothetical protein
MPAREGEGMVGCELGLTVGRVGVVLEWWGWSLVGGERRWREKRKRGRGSTLDHLGSPSFFVSKF